MTHVLPISNESKIANAIKLPNECIEKHGFIKE